MSTSVDWATLRTGSVNLSDSLSAVLEEMILEARIADGARLPSERELAVELGVSRTSLREALRQLELKGLVDRRPGRGTVIVGSQSREMSIDLLAKLSGEERTIREVMDLRVAIEPPVAARAAARATAQNVRRLREIQAEIEKAQGSLERTTELDVAFHNEIARATHNGLLIRLVETASEWFEPSRKKVQTSRRRKATVSAHRNILEAIAAHDPVAAELAMREHLEEVSSFLRQSGANGNGKRAR